MDYVIGLDSSTQSTKAIAWSKSGELIAEGRADIPMNSPHEGRFEQLPEDWWAAACSSLKDLFREVDPKNCQAIAVSNQRETVGFIDENGKSVSPGIVWLDERAVNEVDPFNESFGEARLHAISGKPKDVTPVLYRLAWLNKHQPDVLRNSSAIVDVNGFLCRMLAGTATASWTSADPFGLFDIEQKQWSPDILAALDLNPEQLPPVVSPGSSVGTVSASAAAETSLMEGTPVIAAGGDGQCAGLGVNAMQPGRVYLNLGTALITGVWSADPHIGYGWRTMTSPTGEGYFLEGVLRAGTFYLDWVAENYAGQAADGATHAALQAAAANLPVGSEGVLASPYLSGCMNPHWDMGVRAAFKGFAPNHGRAHLYRSAMEALTGEVARTVQEMRDNGVVVSEIIAVGGGANSALWRSMIADATGLPMKISRSLEASALGAGMTAAVGCGWYPDFESASEGMSGMGSAYEPDPANYSAWQELLARQHAFNLECCPNSRLAE
ncbi:MAG: FGGY-family carbohydrate kinase [Pseudomonadota bacterium]